MKDDVDSTTVLVVSSFYGPLCTCTSVHYNHENMCFIICTHVTIC